MKKLADLIVEKRKGILIVFILLTIVSTFLLFQVQVNSDMTKYLPDDSSAKIGISIMEAEFPPTSSLQVMIKGLPEAAKEQKVAELSAIEHVDSVVYEAGSDAYNQGDYTLYSVTIGVDAYSKEAKTVVSAIRDQNAAYEVALSGEAAGKNLDRILPGLFGAAFGILMVVLILMCNSWLEPVLFLATIVVAILINMGTNIILGSVSDITQAIAAILQLCLSMDYSIMLINRYRQEKEVTDDKNEAMKKAVRNAFTAITSSSVTTIVGMLALVFMSFTIGADMGFVLAKGVFFSLLCIFTVLPALILMFDNAITKTAKKSLHIKMDGLAKFSYSARYVMLAVFVLLFAGSYMLRGNVEITYTMTDFDPVYKVFTPSNPIVVLYENKDEEKVAALAEEWEALPSVDSVSAYATTLGKAMTSTELADATGMDAKLVALMYVNYFDSQGGETPEQTVVLGDFIQFLQTDVATNPQFAALFPEGAMEQLAALGSAQDAQPRLSPEEFAAYSGMNAVMVQQLFGYYFTLNGQAEDGKIAVNDLADFIVTTMAANPQYASFFSEEMLAQLSAMAGDSGTNVMEQQLTGTELAAYMGVDEAIARQLINFYGVAQGNVPGGKIALYDFMNYIATDIATDEAFAPYLTGDLLAQLTDGKAEMDAGLAQLVGSRFSRLILNTNLLEESEETFALIERIQGELGAAVQGEYHLVGSSVMAHEMAGSFPGEMDLITILTAVAIFLVVAISFRSLSIPLVLVLVIQCAVFITMGTAALAGSSIYYLPLLIVQCLLMGSTIDYGILYTSYYREARETLDKKEALRVALNNAIHTIMTSALILIAITLVLGFLLAGSDHAISEILLIIARGGICATVLVVFVLPSVMSALDRFVCGKKKVDKKEAA